MQTSSAASLRFGSGVPATREPRHRHQQRTRWVWQWPFMPPLQDQARRQTLYAPNLQSWPSFDLKCLINSIQNSRIAERLVQELRGSLFERLLPDAFVF